MFEATVRCNDFEALVSGRKKHHALVRYVGSPEEGDSIRIAEVSDQGPTGRACFARVTFVEAINIEVTILSVDVRMSTDRMPALNLPHG